MAWASAPADCDVLAYCDADMATASQQKFMDRHTVQFHWQNSAPGYADFDAFLQSLNQEKRKKIRQERRRVADAGVQFRWARGADITPLDWDFFELQRLVSPWDIRIGE